MIMKLLKQRSETAILILDCQNDTLHEKGALSNGAGAKIIPQLVELIKGGRAVGVPVIFVQHLYRPDYADMPKNFPFAQHLKDISGLRAGSWGGELIAELDPQPTEFVLTKSRGSAFYGTDLDGILRDAGITHLILAGVATNGVVEFTARDASDRGYFITLAEDACVAANEQLHDMLCATSFRILGDVHKTADIVGAL